MIKDTKIAIVLFFALTCILSCRKADRRLKFTNAEEYISFVSACIDESINAHNQTNEVSKGYNFCMIWCDSMELITNRNNDKLSKIQPFEGDSSLTVRARDLNTYLNHIARKDQREYIEMIFAHQEYNQEYERTLHQTEERLYDNFLVKIHHFEIEKKTVLEKFNL